MRRLAGIAVFLLAACSGHGASGAHAGHGGHDPAPTASGTPTVEDRARAEHDAMLDRDWPLHGIVTGLQLVVRTEPRPDATQLGWLRIGSRLRLKRESTPTPTCAHGWHAIYPHGYACLGEGITVGDTDPQADLVVAPPARDAPLPYDYWRVNDELVPSFHQLPSRDQQREAAAYADRYSALLQQDPAKAARFLAGTLPGAPPKPLAVRNFLHRAFFVAGAGVDVRSRRRFVRTVRGQYIKAQQLALYHGSDFHGVELGDGHTLPIAWAVRETVPMRRVTLPDGTVRFADDHDSPPLARLSIVPWARREHVGDKSLHVLADGRYVRDWYLAVAERVDKPREVGDDEPWVHVDVGEQTLVVYRGATPIYATLVSTGLAGHDTPLGLFTIREKHVADTMSDLGADTPDAMYSIEDVPWTEYFSGSLAVHGAFWHDRWGLKHSHGCVNLAPRDAHWVFNVTWPEVPEGWHGITTDHTGLRGSHVLITE